jgi:hypothetical protein
MKIASLQKRCSLFYGSGKTKIKIIIFKTFSLHFEKAVDWIRMVQNRVRLQA